MMNREKGARLKDSQSWRKPQVEPRWAILQPSLTHRRSIKEEPIAISLGGFTTRHADCRIVSKLYPTIL